MLTAKAVVLLTFVINDFAPLVIIGQIAEKYFDSSTLIAFIFVLFHYFRPPNSAGIKTILMRLEICHTEPIMKIANMT